ncbi:hypothetical protein XELAEV_18027395mg [Xenopus laevis]|uniref:Uncharacterized protein n=1 Tax=Xenopus laevis TaxID=8355 RepID=A0A974HJY1_XENLA|nr:hypothetical protein XELAEV_18027395mg [Xenopus laevis]
MLCLLHIYIQKEQKCQHQGSCVQKDMVCIHVLIQVFLDTRPLVLAFLFFLYMQSVLCTGADIIKLLGMRCCPYIHIYMCVCCERL